MLMVLGLHAAAGLLLLRRSAPPMLTALPEPIVLDLAAETAASPAEPPELTPVADTAPTTASEPDLTDAPRPEPVETTLPELAAAEVPAKLPRPAVRATKPRSPVQPNRPARKVDASADAPLQAAGPRPEPSRMPAMPTVPSFNAAAESSWRSLLLGRLQAAKRYPERARAHGDQGMALISFSMDRSGRLLASRLVQSSGSTLLDNEAIAMIARAEPLPPPPPDMPGASLTLTVPVSFALR